MRPTAAPDRPDHASDTRVLMERYRAETEEASVNGPGFWIALLALIALLVVLALLLR